MISIALATYNGEEYLRQQLESIYAQTHKDIEVVACDDCSSDGTVIILKEYEKKYGLRLYVNDTNLGFVKNFEKAISLCGGEYIAPSDQDDIWKPNKLGVLLQGIGENELIFSDMSLIDADGVEMTSSVFKGCGFDPERSKSYAYMSFRGYVAGCTVLFRKKLLDDALPFPEEVPHDYWLSLVALHRNKLTYVLDQLVCYRQHNSNQIGIKRRSSFKDFLNLVFAKDYVKERRLKKMLGHSIFNAKERRELTKAYHFYASYRFGPIVQAVLFLWNVNKFVGRSKPWGV
jgi:glycosyltransferase involved in cell wall biosynthesis